MKKIVCILLTLVLISVLLCGCGDSDDTAAKSDSAATPTAALATPSPTPVPTATPFTRVAVNDYVMQWKNDAARGINYMIPTHWILESAGERYLVYFEPVPDGENGFRVALANKKKSTEPDTDAMRSELRKLMNEMQKLYTDFSWNGSISRDYWLVKFKGYSGTYYYTDEYGVRMEGFVIIATYNRRIYCMNFSGPEDRFDEMKLIGNKILESITRAS